MSAEQRGDLAEDMLPVAAHLAVLVHGDGGPEDVAEVLAGLDDTQKNALIVVLAGLVDPEQPVGKALGWLDVTKHGALPVPAWIEQRPIIDHVPEPELEDDDTFIDEVAVRKYLWGKSSEVTVRERLQAIKTGVEEYGMKYPDFDALHHLRSGSTATFVSRTRKAFEERGEPFPGIRRMRVFTEAEVVAIRESSVRGTPDVQLAVAFDTSRETIRSICRGERYPQFGGPVRAARSARGVQASREYMCGHADNSLAAGNHKQIGKAA